MDSVRHVEKKKFGVRNILYPAAIWGSIVVSLVINSELLMYISIFIIALVLVVDGIVLLFRYGRRTLEVAPKVLTYMALILFAVACFFLNYRMIGMIVFFTIIIYSAGEFIWSIYKYNGNDIHWSLRKTLYVSIIPISIFVYSEVDSQIAVLYSLIWMILVGVDLTIFWPKRKKRTIRRDVKLSPISYDVKMKKKKEMLIEASLEDPNILEGKSLVKKICIILLVIRIAMIIYAIWFSTKLGLEVDTLGGELFGVMIYSLILWYIYKGYEPVVYLGITLWVVGLISLLNSEIRPLLGFVPSYIRVYYYSTLFMLVCQGVITLILLIINKTKTYFIVSKMIRAKVANKTRNNQTPYSS